jgi:hypothetical protein
VALTVFAFLRSREPCHHHLSPRPRRHGIHQIQRFRSVEGFEALVEAGNKFQLGPAVMAGAWAPILILHGQATHAYLSPWLSKYTATSPIRIRPLLVYPPGRPGCAHCQLDALGVAQRDICDWLDDKVLA